MHDDLVPEVLTEEVEAVQSYGELRIVLVPPSHAHQCDPFLGVVDADTG